MFGAHSTDHRVCIVCARLLGASRDNQGAGEKRVQPGHLVCMDAIWRSVLCAK